MNEPIILPSGWIITADPKAEGCKRAIVFLKKRIIFMSPAMFSLLETDRKAVLASLKFLNADALLDAEMAGSRTSGVAT